MLFANVCAGFICYCYEGCVVRRFLGYPSCVQDSGYAGVPIAGHAHWAEVGGGIICATLGEFTGLHKSVPCVFRVMEVIPFI